MKILSFDCSAGPVSCAVTEGNRLLGQFFIDVRLTHSQTLLPMAEALLRSQMLKISDIEAFAISNGPGSFTGIRIGVAAVKGMAEPGQQPCVGVSTLEAIARPHAEEGLLCAVMDARCGQVYNALFSTVGNFERLCEDRAVTIGLLGEELVRLHEAKPGRSILLAGDGARLVYDTLKLDFLRLATPPNHCQTAYGVALAAVQRLENGGGVPAAELMPVYLRLPQAERELIKRQKEKADS